MAAAPNTLVLTLETQFGAGNRQIDGTNRKLDALGTTLANVSRTGSNSFGRLERDAIKAASGFDRVHRSVQGLQGVLGAMAMFLAVSVTAPLGLAARYAFNAAKDMDSTRKGLTAILGDGADISRQIKELRELARNPGLDFAGTANGVRKLVAAGLTVSTATAAIREFGNALALVGGSSEDLSGVTIALQQIASKSKVSAEEINQLAERMPQIRKLMVAVYGTADTEALQKRKIQPIEFLKAIIKEAENLPRATSGTANELKNFFDEVRVAVIPVGEDIARLVLPSLKALSKVIQDVGAAYAALSPETRRWIILIGGIAFVLGPVLFALNMLRGTVAGVMGAFKMWRDSLVSNIATQAAQAAATKAQTAAMEEQLLVARQLAITRMTGGAAPAAEVFAGNPTVGRTAAQARAMELEAAGIAARERALARFSQNTKAREQAREPFFRHIKVGGAPAHHFGTGSKPAQIFLGYQVGTVQATAKLASMQAENAKAAAEASAILSAAAPPAATAVTKLSEATRLAAGGMTALKVAGAAFLALPLIGVIQGIGRAFSNMLGDSAAQGGTVAVLKAVGRELRDISGITISPIRTAISGAISDIKQLGKAYDQFVEGVSRKVEGNPFLFGAYKEILDVGRRRIAGEQMASEVLRDKQLRVLNDARLQGEAAGSLRKIGTRPKVQEEEDEKIAKRRSELMRELKDQLANATAEARVARKQIDEVTKIQLERTRGLASMVEKEGAAFTASNQAIYKRITGMQMLEAAAKQSQAMEEGWAQAIKKVTDATEKLMEAEEAGFRAKLARDERHLRPQLAIAKARFDLGQDIDLGNMTAERDRQIAALDLVEGVTVGSKVRTEQAKLLIEQEFIKKSLDLTFKRIEMEHLMEGAGAESAEKARVAKEAARVTASLEIERLANEAQVKQYRIMRDEALRNFNSIKDGAGRVFDALLLRTESFGDAVKNILKTAFLTPVREFAATLTAVMMTGGNPQGAKSAGGSSIQKLFNVAMGGMTSGGAVAATPPFVDPRLYGSGAPSSSGGWLERVSSVFDRGMVPMTSGGPMYSNRDTMVMMPGGPLSTGRADAGGGLQGLFSDQIGMLTKLGNLGATQKIFAKGVYGAKGGAMLGAGGLLAFDGLRRGGLIGLGETTAGGALIGAKFGGPAGAAIGAGIGAAAGIVRLFFKGADQKVRNEIKRTYGVDIPDKALLRQISETAKSSYGGDIRLAIQSPQVRELVELYAMMTGQKASGLPAKMSSTTFVQSGGALYQSPTFTNGVSGGMYPVGGLGSMAATGPAAVVVQLDGPATTALLRGEAVEAMQENPRAVQTAVRTATRSNAGRRELVSLQFAPGTLTS